MIGRTYDSAGRLDIITSPTGNRHYAYYSAGCVTAGCAAGKLASIAGPATTNLSYSWDGRLMTSVGWSGAVTGQVGFSYDTDFRVNADTATAGTGSSRIYYGYEADSLLTCASPTSCSPAAGDALKLKYLSDASLLSATTIGTVTDAFEYNSYGELASTATSFGSTLLYREVLDSTASPRDVLGRIVQKAETRGIWSQVFNYTYDLQGHLTNVRQGATTLEHFEYHLNGNRLKGIVNGSTRNGTYDDQDRLLTYVSFTYSYTPNGELFTKTDSETGEVTTYHYDALGNLLSVELPDSTLIEYVIDGQNRRIGKRIDGILTKAWLYKDQLKPIAELDGSGNLTARFVYGSKSNVQDVVMKYNGGVVTTYRVISDHLGSPVMAVNVNNSADVPFRAEYSAFGERNLTSAATSADWVPFGFAGGLCDADTGLTRFGLRDYDAMIGRWTAKDAIRFAASRNLYEYVWNDPTNLVDLTGLAPSNGAGGATSTGCGGSEGTSSTGSSLPEPSADSYTVDTCGSGPNSRYIPETFGGVKYGESCKTHDECYATCGSDKQGCDLNLTYDIATDCARQGGGVGCDTVAGLYGLAVDWKGQPYYDAAQQQSGCK